MRGEQGILKKMNAIKIGRTLLRAHSFYSMYAKKHEFLTPPIRIVDTK
jgi:hypothetical protein